MAKTGNEAERRERKFTRENVAAWIANRTVELEDSVKRNLGDEHPIAAINVAFAKKEQGTLRDLTREFDLGREVAAQVYEKREAAEGATTREVALEV